MFADTWLLMSLRWQLAYNGFRARSRVRQVFVLLGMLAVGATLGSFAAGVGALAAGLLSRFPGSNLESLLPGLILTAAVVLLLLSSFGVALGSLFLSSDLELLMTAPVDRRAVFISKILDGLGLNYAVLAVTALPALFTYGFILHYAPLYYVLSVLAVVASPLLPEGLGALLVLLVARFAPARRVREFMGFMAAIFGLGCSVLGQSSRLWMNGITRGANTDPAALKALVAQVAGLPIPSLVAGRGLTAAGTGDLAGAFTGLAGFALITAGFFAGCVWLADWLYAAGWMRMQSSGVARRSRRRVERDATTAGWLGRAPAFLALALKDWRVIPRDLRNFAQMLGPIVLLPVFYFNLLGGSGRRSFNPLQAAEGITGGAFDPTGVLIASGILMSVVLLCTQISSTAISMEAKSWWLIKAAPITPWELVRGKFMAAWLPFAILSTVLLGGAAVWQHLSPLGVLYGWLGMQLLGGGILAMSLGFALRWPRLDWDNPKQMHSGWASLATFAGEALIGLLGGALLCLPLAAEVMAPSLELPAYLVGIIGAALVSGGVAWGALNVGLDNLPNIGEA
ncbi:MAG TPA: hypothetical protein VM536_22465 [Chloroflexia bacterium]|nr:hypothetical protein [Chloroflexia bacterium]